MHLFQALADCVRTAAPRRVRVILLLLALGASVPEVLATLGGALNNALEFQSARRDSISELSL